MRLNVVQVVARNRVKTHRRSQLPPRSAVGCFVFAIRDVFEDRSWTGECVSLFGFQRERKAVERELVELNRLCG